MNVLVIGGAGYIGSHVVQALLAGGNRVTVFDNLSSGLRENLFSDAAFIHGDIMRPAQLRHALSDSIEAVVHLAAFKAAGESMILPWKYAENNLSGTINIINAMIETGVKRLVFSSSAAVYGEPRYLPIDESHPQVPENFYGFTKLEIERILEWYDRLAGLRFAALRYFNAAGYDPDGNVVGLEQNPANLLPVIMDVARGVREKLQVFGTDYETPDGTGVRDYIHVSDLARGHVQALEYIAGNDRSLTVNLGSEQGLSVLEILEAARRLTGREIPAEFVARRPGDPAKLVASSRFAGETLDWKAESSDVETLISSSWNVYRRYLD